MSAGSEQAASRVRALMERIANAVGVDADVEIDDADGGVIAEYVGEDLEPLIGPHGEMLDAIQHLAYRFAMHGDGDRLAVVVDADGYRVRRATALCQAADQAAVAAIADRRPVALEAMSALERKVIHEHLKDRRDVETYSEGQEPSRHLVVAPLVS